MTEKMQESQINLKVTDDAGISSLPDFHDLHLIAEGASGKVYSARRNIDSSLVALKVYRKELTPDGEATIRFQHEVATLKRLSHPNIVKILGAGQTESGESYIYMEKAAGSSLQQILEAEGPLESRRAAVISREICRALEVAHAQGLVHRDLKPSNVIVDKNDIAKVVDFGVAKAISSSSDTITQYGAVIGTPSYMSPEQCRGRNVDQRSDIYSLGCTMFEMLTTKKAFEADSAISTLAKQIDKDRSFLKPALDARSINPELQRIILKCLEREPEKRYETVDALDHDLSAFLLGIPKIKQRGKLASQIAVCVCAVFLVLIVFELIVLQARQHVETGGPRTAFGVPEKIEIKNRFNGTVIFTDEAPRLTLRKALEDAAVRGVSLQNADLNGADLVQAKLVNLDLRNSDLSNAKLVQATIDNVKFDNALMAKANLTQAKINNSSFRDVQMSGARMVQVRAPRLDFRGADLSRTDMIQADFRDCDLRYANLSGAKTTQVYLWGADITNAKITPQENGFETNVHGCISNGVRL